MSSGDSRCAGACPVETPRCVGFAIFGVVAAAPLRGAPRPVSPGEPAVPARSPSSVAAAAVGLGGDATAAAGGDAVAGSGVGNGSIGCTVIDGFIDGCCVGGSAAITALAASC